MRNEMASFAEVALSPFAIDKFCHTVISSWIIGAIFVIAVSCWYLLKKRHTELATKSIKIGSAVGLVASLLALHTGDHSAYMVAQVQPMKLAAMEALYDGGEKQGLTAIALVNPFEQPDYASHEEAPLKIEIPYALSFLATRDINGYVPGVNDLLKDSDEKIRRGRLAITALKEYRQKEVTPERKAQLLKDIQENMPYFGYGYIKDKSDLVPYIPLCFYAFRVMVGLGTLFLLFFAVMTFISWRKDVACPKLRLLHIAAIALLPLGYICSESGWLVAEFGRQPWAIQDMMPTWVGVSNIGSSSVMLTFFIFLALFTTLLAVEISILIKAIKQGPEEKN